MSSHIPQITDLLKQVSTSDSKHEYIYAVNVYQKNFNILINEINKLRDEIEELKKAKISTS